ncbi:MAG: cyclopropane-fatty-acyl-phospholipid synthase family protein [Rubripirellula sp.]
MAKLRGIKSGRVTVVDGETSNTFGDQAADLHATIQVHDVVFYRSIALGGSIGAGESYRDGHWSCDDLVALIRVFARNMQASSDLGGLGNALLDVGRKVAHRFNRNTRTGSRRNIAAHYDLSNDFYSLFLDETMTYSSGVFPSPDSSLRDASIEKYDRICRKLRLTSSDELLEIGTGWGGFAEHAVRHYGCRVTTTTISKQQHDFAKQRFESLGINQRVTLLMQDYRDLTGEYDKLVSIEMIEAVGHEYFDTFFAKCSSLLKPDGLFAMQAITIPDQRYDRYRMSVDFIQKYIFPGGCLPSLGAMTGSVGRATDFQFLHLEDFALHYARTLKCWHENFHRNANSIRGLGMSESFLRLWDFYLCYCEGAFREKQIGVSQILLQKPGNRLDPQFPSLGSI